MDPYEIFVVNTGSADSTDNIIKSCGNVQYAEHENKGVNIMK